jgi:CDP-paratose 2-epimerase
MPSVALITGSAGLIGAEASRFFARQGYEVAGVDNDLRKTFFGEDASTTWSRRRLEEEIPDYRHHELDIRDREAIERLFETYSSDIQVVIHTAAQPSHDWASAYPHVDFAVNAGGTLNLLESTRRFCPQAAFVFTSTNKVYGDRPNELPLVEQETRWEVESGHRFAEHGIDETMAIDQTLHSLFGASKLAADCLVQEYGRYFGLKTGCFRAGCLTGPGHCGVKLHGFLSYLARCCMTGAEYTVLGYQGKQVRDNLHAADLVNMFWHFCRQPRPGEVYNVGGSRHANCSMLEAIRLCEELTGKKLKSAYHPTARTGDHIWYVSDVRKFQNHYPDWAFAYDLNRTLEEIVDAIAARL